MNATISASFTLPNYETLTAIPCALMVRRKRVSTPAMTYSEVSATRLPAYIESLRKRGLWRSIVARDLPLTPKQRLRKHSTPFAEYFMEPRAIEQLGEAAQEWALMTLRYHEVSEEKFPFYEAWLEPLGGAK